MKRIEKEWLKFKAAVLGQREVDPVELLERRRMFMAGAAATLVIVTEITPDMSDEDGVALLEGCEQETREFIEAMQRGEA